MTQVFYVFYEERNAECSVKRMRVIIKIPRRVEIKNNKFGTRNTDIFVHSLSA